MPNKVPNRQIYEVHRKKRLLFVGLPLLLIIACYGVVVPTAEVEDEPDIESTEAEQIARSEGRVTDTVSSTLRPEPPSAVVPVTESTEVSLSRDSCALFVMAAIIIEPRGVEYMKNVADKYAPGMTLELVLWFSERLDTIPTANVDMVNFAKMLALVREGAIPSIEMGDYYTLRSRYNRLKGGGDAETIVREIIGDEGLLHERFGRIDTTNIQIQIDKQKERGIADCADLDKLSPVSVTVALHLDGFKRGKCDRAIQFYSERMEIPIRTFSGVDGERRASATLSFRSPQHDTYEPRLITTLQKTGESIAEACARP